MRLPSRPALAYLHDLVVTALAFLVAFYLRVGDLVFGYYADTALLGAAVMPLVGGATYRLLGLYRGVWRYASIPDLLQIVRAATVATVALVVLMFFVNRLEAVPRSLPLINWFVLIVMLGASRFAYRLFKDRQIGLALRPTGPGPVPVLLVGAGDEADLFIRHLGNDRGAAYRAVGVLDDKGSRVGRAIRNVPVLATVDRLEEAVANLERRGTRPQRVILTKSGGEIGREAVSALLDRAERLGLTMARLPSLTEFREALGEGRLELRPVAVEDLLGRPQVRLDRAAIRSLIEGRRVLVTGAGGSIGGELTRQIAALAPASLLLVEAGEYNLYAIEREVWERFPNLDCRPVLCDVRDAARVARVFEDFRPELVFHAAALKHVPLVEANVCEGALTNVAGTRNVARAARAMGTRVMVQVSTDKAIRPTSVMGATKRAAEAVCQALDVTGGHGNGDGATRFVTVRFGNVLDSSGSVVPLFRRQLAAGGPLTVTHPEMRRYFMTIREAVELVLQASAHGARAGVERGKIFVLDMGEPVRIVDLARQMIRLAGLRPGEDVDVAFTGLRPGEKLFEEILDPDELPDRTQADGVFVASPRLIDHALLNRAVDELEAAARNGDADRVLTVLGNLVPDFAANRRQAAAAG